MTIGFIGCGNMGSAIIKGITEAGVIESSKIFAFDPYAPSIDKAVKAYGITKCGNAKEIIMNSNIVVLAVKPNMIASVLQEINFELEKKDTIVISIAAGKTLEFIRDNLTHDNKLVRIMPNINAKVAAACSAYCTNGNVTDEEKKEIEKIFGTVGTIMELPESNFSLFGVLAGCSPAFVYMFIDALARAGVKNGMKKDTALQIAAQSVLGSAKMILESDTHPFELIDQVCSPGGTTIEGVTSLQADGFEAAIHKAVDKAVDKDSRL
ncbi:MAG: pyrroline-5-carboxylate reductase [Eubacterium sp.]|nr:pyrroline-5-carboxylate reductase [Eubacterium sp.]